MAAPRRKDAGAVIAKFVRINHIWGSLPGGLNKGLTR
jgi:hypothetical protein